jgi:hypothetical protein
MHAIGFKGRSIVSQAHICVNLEDIATLEKSVFCVLSHSIPEDFISEMAREIALPPDIATLYICLAKVFSLALQATEYVIDGDALIVTFPEAALVTEKFPYLQRIEDIFFCTLHIAEEERRFNRKCRLALDLSGDAFSLFPTFFPSFTVDEFSVVASPLDLLISTPEHPVIPSSFLDIACRLAMNRVSFDRPLLQYVIAALQGCPPAFGEVSHILPALLEAASKSENTKFLKEFCNVVAMCFFYDDVDNFRSFCAQISQQYSRIILDLCLSLVFEGEDQKIRDFVNFFTPRLVFFMQDFESPFILEKLRTVSFSPIGAFFTCFFDAAAVVEDFSGFVVQMKKKQATFERMMSKGTQSQLCALKAAAEKAQQEIFEKSISVFNLFGNSSVDDVLFCRHLLSLYLLKEYPGDERVLIMNRMLSAIGEALTKRRYYEDVVEEISKLIAE